MSPKKTEHKNEPLYILGRQIIHREAKVGINKAVSAKHSVAQLNSDVTVTAIAIKVDHSNIVDILKDVDVVVDATDNFEARYLINDACVILSKPLVSGSAVSLEGQVTVLHSPGPCYRYCSVQLLSWLLLCSHSLLY